MRLLIFYMLLPAACLSQQSLTADQFFALGLSDFEQTEQAAGGKVDFPWIDQYEFRTETRDFDLDRQEYTLRLSPSTAKIRKAQKAYYEELRNAPDFAGQEIYCDLKLTLQLDWLSLFMLRELQAIMDEWVIILNDKQTVYEKIAGTYEFDPQQILKLQTEKSDLEIALNKIKLDREYLLNKYGIQDMELDFGDFVTIETIAANLNDILLVQSHSGLVDMETEHEKQLLIKEIELESSEKNKLIDFVQVKYNGPHTDALEERLSVGLGFQFANSGSKKLKMQELQIEKEELNLKSARNIQEKQEKLDALENKLQNGLQAFFHFQQIMQEERVQLQKLSSNISQKEGSSPLFLLEIEERNLTMKIKSLNENEDLIKDYLKYLHQSGKMCQHTFVNYLSR